MLSNPVVEAKEAEEKLRKEKEAFRHEFVVTCVVPYIEDINNHPSFRIVKRFCEENHVPFSAREYDYRRYTEDCEHIPSMPAFHFYDRNGHLYFDTFLPEENPIQKIQDEILRWRKEQEKKRARKEAWEKKVSGLISFFENLTSFKKKPALKQPLPAKKKAAVAKVPLEYIDKPAPSSK